MTVLLLHTHTFIWWIGKQWVGRNVIPAHAVDQINAASDIYVSMATVWEMAIKVALGKLEDHGTTEQLIEQAGFVPLPISFSHIELIKTLPHHHRDPFDRMLIAQALAETMPIISNETAFDAYGVTRIWE